MNSPPAPAILPAIRQWWRETSGLHGRLGAARRLVEALWDFLRDSTPSRRRQRYGDADYDWDHRVNTTSAAVRWRDRLLGHFHSPYQPTDPNLFREMMDGLLRASSSAGSPENDGVILGAAALQAERRISQQKICGPTESLVPSQPELAPGPSRQRELSDFLFLDLGSGKGRTLLMASDYPFRRIAGIELLPALHQIAQENLASYTSSTQRCFNLQSICADATNFSFPDEPTVLYLFNPFPEAGLRRVIANIEQSLNHAPRPFFLLYHNPQLEKILHQSSLLKKLGGTHQYAIYRFAKAGE